MIYNMRDRMPDLIAASLAVVMGLFTLYESSGYDMGSLRDMGPGYFPRILAIMLIGLGLALVMSTLRQGPVRLGGGRVPLWSVLMICAALVSFALLIEQHGIIPAIFSAVFLSTFASDNRNIARALVLAAATAVSCAVLFVYLLGLSMKVFAL
jgi:hypothetical protein